MARAGITYSEVTQAASALQGSGKKITIETVRHYLGTGSHSTISKYLNDWRKANEMGPLGPGTHLPEEVLSFTKGLWSRLYETAQSEIHAYQEESAKKAQESKDALIAVQKILEEKKLRLHETEEQFEQCKGEQRKLNDELHAARNSNTKLAERIKNLESQLNQWDDKYTKLHELLKSTQSNLEHYQEESQKLREKQLILDANKEQSYQIKLDELLKKYMDELNKKSFYEAEFNRTEKINQELKKSNEEKQILLKTVEEEQQRTSINLEWATKQNKQLEIDNELKSKELKRVETLVSGYKLELEVAKENLKRLESIMLESQAKIETLRQDNMFLNQEKANLSEQFNQLQATLYHENRA